MSRGLAADCLRMAPRGARLPRSTIMLPWALIGSARERITSCGSLASTFRQHVAQAAAGHGGGIEIEPPGQLVHQPRHAAGPVEVLHVVLARRLEVDQHRHLAADGIDLVEIDRDAEPSGRGG